MDQSEFDPLNVLRDPSLREPNNSFEKSGASFKYSESLILFSNSFF